VISELAEDRVVEGVFAWRRKEAAAILDDVGEGRDDEAGFRIWTRR